MDERLKAYDEKMQKTCDHLASDYLGIRAGRANPHVLDKLFGIILIGAGIRELFYKGKRQE